MFSLNEGNRFVLCLTVVNIWLSLTKFSCGSDFTQKFWSTKLFDVTLWLDKTFKVASNHG